MSNMKKAKPVFNMGNMKKTRSVFGDLIDRIHNPIQKEYIFCGFPDYYLLNGKQRGRNAETFYIDNLVKLGYLFQVGCIYYKKKTIPLDYNSARLREEMKELKENQIRKEMREKKI